MGKVASDRLDVIGGRFHKIYNRDIWNRVSLRMKVSGSESLAIGPI